MSTRDPEREETYLKVLRESGGSRTAAAAATGGHLIPGRTGNEKQAPGYSSWLRREASDPEWAARVAEVLDAVKDDVRQEIHRRAVHGVKSHVHQKAQLVWEPKFDDDGNPVLDAKGNPVMVPATVTRYSDAALLRLAASLMPEFRDQKDINVTHNVGRLGEWRIGLDDLSHLNADDKKELARIMDRVRDGRKTAAAIEHRPEVAEAVDAEFETVNADDDWHSDDEPIPF